MEIFRLKGDYITLGQALKVLGVIGTGGNAKNFLSDVPVKVNGEKEERRGRKLRVGDHVIVPGYEETLIYAEEPNM